MPSRIIDRRRREGICKRSCCAGNTLAADPIIIAVPNESATALEVLPFKECINKLVVAGMPDCKIPIPIQKSIMSFLKKVNKGVAIIADERA